MANWSQSHFLQSLGWATLNSFWQMALLWCVFLALNACFRLSAQRRYQLAVGGILAGFAWAVLSFFTFYNETAGSSAFFPAGISRGDSSLHIFLLAASMAYLGLLIFPAYRLWKNWLFVQKIRKEGLHKAELSYRLFVQKVSGHLGIGKKVLVYVSDVITSPVTVGYLKPVILLPVAAMSHLSVQQVEAVLLHELSHIRRFDYLLNIIISVISAILYFNPFVKYFVRAVEAERENCCDELVLQFGYDKVGYASALLTLEKLSAQSQQLALAATGKNYLLERIEKIVGMERKKKFRFTQLATVLAALLFIIAFNSIMIIREQKKNDPYFSFGTIGNPLVMFSGETDASTPTDYPVAPVEKKTIHDVAARNTEQPERKEAAVVFDAPPAVASYLPPAEPAFMQVKFNAADAALDEDQKEQVTSAMAATKKIVSELQWTALEAQIADALTEKEKIMAQKEYLKEVEKINWNTVEQNLKAQYEKIDWQQVNEKMTSALTMIQLDSLQKNYTSILVELEKADKQLAEAKNVCTPMPDVSVVELKRAKEEMKAKVDTIKQLRKKVVRL